MNLTVMPRPLGGAVDAVASKSDVHRCLICAGLADRPCEIALHSEAQDILATMRVLESLGARMEPVSDGVRVHPVCGNAPVTADCGESGSTLRFVVPVAAALGRQAEFIGSGRLPERPMAVCTSLLAQHGCTVCSAESTGGLSLPLRVRGQLAGGEYALRGDISSQYITGLLLALPLLSQPSRIRLTTPLESAGYVAMTIDTLSRFGVHIENAADGWVIPAPQRFRSPETIRPDGDWSSAAFWLAAFALGGGGQVSGLRAQSLQGDRRMAQLTARFGARVIERDGTWCVEPAECPSGDRVIDAADIPDLVPVLSVLAAARAGTTRFKNCGRLRLKESDRIRAVCDMVNALGGRAAAQKDDIVVAGGSLSGGTVDGVGDHRIVMAAAVASAACSGPVTILGAEAVRKSYPTFFDDFRKLGGDVRVL